MANFSDYYRNHIVNHMLRDQTFDPPSPIYVALFKEDAGLQANNPTDEVDASGYVRKELILSEATTPAGDSDNALIEWDAAEADWGEVKFIAIVDHEENEDWGTDVNVLMWDGLVADKTINENDIFRLPAGNLEVEIR